MHGLATINNINGRYVKPFTCGPCKYIGEYGGDHPCKACYNGRGFVPRYNRRDKVGMAFRFVFFGFFDFIDGLLIRKM